MSEVRRQRPPFATVLKWLLFSDVSDRAVRLYAVLDDRAGEDRMVFPARRWLAEALRCSVDSVDRAMKELVDAGAVRVQYRHRTDGGQTSNDYELLDGQAPETDHQPPVMDAEPPDDDPDERAERVETAPDTASDDDRRAAEGVPHPRPTRAPQGSGTINETQYEQDLFGLPIGKPLARERSKTHARAASGSPRPRIENYAHRLTVQVFSRERKPVSRFVVVRARLLNALNAGWEVAALERVIAGGHDTWTEQALAAALARDARSRIPDLAPDPGAPVGPESLFESPAERILRIKPRPEDWTDDEWATVAPTLAEHERVAAMDRRVRPRRAGHG